MSAVQPGALSSKLTAVHSLTQSEPGIGGEGQGAAGFRADTAPGFASAVGGATAAHFIGAAVLVATSRTDTPLPENLCGFRYPNTTSFSWQLSWLFSSSPSLASIIG